MNAATTVADVLLRAGTFFVFLAWILGSGWLLLVFGLDTYEDGE